MSSTLQKKIHISLVFFALLVSGCTNGPGTVTESGSTSYTEPNYSPKFDPTRTVCDPFRTNSQHARDRGLVGNLVYLTNDQPRYTTINEYIANGVLATSTLYLDRIYTPPRPFDLGISTQSGELIKTINGDTLYKNFGIQVKSQLQLAANESPGYYRLAIIAGTGGRIKLTDSNGIEKTIVDTEKKNHESEESENEISSYEKHDDKKSKENNKKTKEDDKKVEENDEHHDVSNNDKDDEDDDEDEDSPKVVCADEPVYLDQNTKIPVTVEYYQGESKHISLIAMWRPWTASDVKSHSEGEHDDDDDEDSERNDFCHRSVKSLFTYSDTAPATPKAKYYEMLASNWKVLENENYQFPDQELNPCVPVEEPLSITEFSISNISRDRVTLTWKTNIAASSQGEAKNVSSGLVISSPIDQTLVQIHTLTITGLSSNTLYAVKALSKTASGQTSVSDERAFRTPR